MTSATELHLGLNEQSAKPIARLLLAAQSLYHDLGTPPEFIQVRIFDQVGSQLDPPVSGEALYEWLTRPIQSPPSNGHDLETSGSTMVKAESLTGQLFTTLDGISPHETREVHYDNLGRARRAQTTMNDVSQRLGWRKGKKRGYTTEVVRDVDGPGATLKITRTNGK